MLDPVQRHPTRAEQLDILVSLVADVCPPGGKVLDLGCGVGYVADLLLSRRPDIAYVGLDRNTEALTMARRNLASFVSAELQQGDLMQVQELGLSGGGFDFVYSALTFHDLDDAGKRALIHWIVERLAPSGCFLLYDRLRLTERSLFVLQQSIWSRIEREYGTGMRTAASFDAYLEDLGTDNRPASLSEYQHWFAEAGLAATVLHLHGNVALIAATRPDG